jgi:protocatechuate 3,4-dioxygenase beta subunit
MINNAAFFRRDITEGKPGTPLTLTLTVVNVNSSCAVVSGLQVEIWQCDAAGNYSEYSQPGFNGTGQTFLRGVQTTRRNRPDSPSRLRPRPESGSEGRPV